MNAQYMTQRNYPMGMTVAELKALIHKWPEVDDNGNPTEVWIQTGANCSSPVKSVWSLNTRECSADMLFESDAFTEKEKTMTDTERLDWLEKNQGAALVSDDDSHWAVSTTGVQNIPFDAPQDIDTSFFVPKEEWHTSIREAIDAAIAAEQG